MKWTDQKKLIYTLKVIVIHPLHTRYSQTFTHHCKNKIQNWQNYALNYVNSSLKLLFSPNLSQIHSPESSYCTNSFSNLHPKCSTLCEKVCFYSTTTCRLRTWRKKKGSLNLICTTEISVDEVGLPCFHTRIECQQFRDFWFHTE